MGALTLTHENLSTAREKSRIIDENIGEKAVR